MGYRWYDEQKTIPEFPFGHGLSYATFAYSNIVVSGTVSVASNASISATICNSAGPAAAEVAQLYVGYPAAANEPPQLLKGFEKVIIAPQACVAVGFILNAADLNVWDVVTQEWVLVPGTYAVRLGSSSRDIRLTASLQVVA